MRKILAVVWSLAGLFTLGCSSPTSVGIRSLAADGADNELALAEKYDGERLRATGTVVTVGQAKREVVNVEYSGGGWAATGRKGYELNPYVSMSPEDGKGGVILFCFFDIEQRGEFAVLERGQLVTVDGTYGSFGKSQGVTMITLWDCSIAN
jgi:hypothetical protein